MLVIGLTGGIGSGKSTVAKLFENLGVPIIDADVIARQITEPGQTAFLAIQGHFKEPLLSKDGSLDRAKLRQIIFENRNERIWLEKLLHPLILAEMKVKIERLSSPYCIAVIPLLIEAAAFPLIDRILVIDTPEHLQIERVVARDKTSQARVKDIIKSQVNREERLQKAHDMIVNDQIMTDLIPQVERLHRLYLELAAKHRESTRHF